MYGLGVVADREEILATVARWEQAQAELAALDFTVLTGPEALGVQQRLEAGDRRQPATHHPLIQQLRARSIPAELGAKSWPTVLSEALRISAGEAKRRIRHAAVLGPRSALT